MHKSIRARDERRWPRGKCTRAYYGFRAILLYQHHKHARAHHVCTDIILRPHHNLHKSMPSLVRYHAAAPKRLLGISYNNMTSDGRASSAQEEHTPSGRQSRKEYRHHTAVVPTRQLITEEENASARRATPQNKHTRAFLEVSLIFRGKEISCLRRLPCITGNHS